MRKRGGISGHGGGGEVEVVRKGYISFTVNANISHHTNKTKHRKTPHPHHIHRQIDSHHTPHTTYTQGHLKKRCRGGIYRITVTTKIT
jgi:hypothetical protein